MTITYTNAAGTGLFDRLGTLGTCLYGAANVDALDAYVNDAVAAYDGDTNALRWAIDGLEGAFEDLRAGGDYPSFRNAVQQAAERALIREVNDHSRLHTQDIETALKYLRWDMLDQSQTVNATEFTATITNHSGNNSNVSFCVSMRDGRGRVWANSRDETVTIICADTSSNSTTTEGSLTCYGESSETTDTLDTFLWPTGSDCEVGVTLLDPATDNQLTDGALEEWTTNTPDNWTIVVGAAGTHITRSASPFNGTYACNFVGDNSTLTTISQTVTGLDTRTNLPVCVRLKVNTAPAAGVMVLELHDGSSVIQDSEGNDQQLSIDLTAIGTSYEYKSTAFRLPDPEPTTVNFRVRLTTAISSGTTVTIDDLFLGDEMDSLYSGGPSVSAIAGSEILALDDRWTLDVAITELGEMQRLFRRLFDQADYLLPVADSPTLADSLVDVGSGSTAILAISGDSLTLDGDTISVQV